MATDNISSPIVNELENKYENLVFEGGGTKALAFIGVLKYFDDRNLLKQFKRVIGSSAGALTSLLFACGLNSEQIKDEILTLPMDEMKDEDIGFIRDADRFIKEFGLYKGERLENEIGKILKKYLGDSKINFVELYKKTNIELTVTMTCVDQGETWYCNYLTEPEMEVKQAVRISMSLPWAFACVKYKGLRFCDGGVYDNFPIDFWDNKQTGEYNHKTLGFLLMSNDEYLGKKQVYDTKDIVKYSLAIIRGSIDRSSLAHYDKELSQTVSRIVKINVGDVSTLDTNLSEEKTKQLIYSGYNSCVNYFKNGQLLTQIDIPQRVPTKKCSNCTIA